MDEIRYTPQGSAIDPDVNPPANGGTDSPQGIHGSEGSLIDQGNGTVIKRYRPGLKCNIDVLQIVKSMAGKGYVANLMDFGSMDFDGTVCDFELMKHYPLGSASDYDLKGNANAILRIVGKIAICLDACHRNGLIHKDVKPSNILIEDTDIWDCVLGDFGFADILKDGKVTTSLSRTPIYAAPEMYGQAGGHTFCTLTPAFDFYSLGMTALSLWCGEEAIYAKEEELAAKKQNGMITVPQEIPNPLRKIICGLLTVDPAKRWSLAEIKLAIQKRDTRAPEEIAAEMLNNWNIAIDNLYNGQISTWLESRPDLKAEIDRIVQKDFPKDKSLGTICAMHILNPLYDLNLRLPGQKGYAMTGESVARVLNDAYNIFFGRFSGKHNRVINEWDGECTKKINSSAIVLRLVHSFDSFSEQSYLVWFLSHKGSRFTSQLSWLQYCLDFDSRENRKKAGPKDTEYLRQTAMMKTIAGFGHTPSYDYPDEQAGLRGFLAVQYHENPNADLSVKYSYERLLEDYLSEYRTHYPGCKEGRRFDEARAIAIDTARKAKRGVGSLTIRSMIQRLVSIILIGVPAIYLMVSAISLVARYPLVDMSEMDFGWTFAIIGIVLCTVSSFLFDIGGSLLTKIIAGVILGFILFIIVKLLGTFVFWIYAAIILTVVVMFSIKVLFVRKVGNINRLKGNPGFMELTLEPLYYAFNDEGSFQSSLSAYIDDNAVSDFNETLRKRRVTILIFVGIVWGLLACQYYIDKFEPSSLTKENSTDVEHIKRGIIDD